MSEDKIGLTQLPNDESGERFMIIFKDGQKLVERHGYVMNTSGPMTEEDVRAFLRRGNMPAADIDAMFRAARDAFSKESPA
jgi:hypothetical protein